MEGSESSKEKGPPGDCRVVPGVRAVLSSVCVEYRSYRRFGELAEVAVPRSGHTPSYFGQPVIAKLESIRGGVSTC